MTHHCMTEDERGSCRNETTRFTVIGRTLFCWCDEHHDGRIPGERPVSLDEWEALLAMEEVHES